jgi:hypothetical protein
MISLCANEVRKDIRPLCLNLDWLFLKSFNALFIKGTWMHVSIAGYDNSSSCVRFKSGQNEESRLEKCAENLCNQGLHYIKRDRAFKFRL